MPETPPEEIHWLPPEQEGEPELLGLLARAAPRGPAARPGIVFAHGWSGIRQGPHRLFVHLARSLAGAGYSSLRFDFSGRGFSGGEPEQADADALIADLRRAGRFLAARAGVARLVYAGICSGGNFALGAAAGQAEPPVAGLLLLSTPLFREQRAGGPAGRRRRLLFAYLGRIFRRDFWGRLVRGQLNVRGAARHLRGERYAKRDPRDSRRDIMAEFARGPAPLCLVYGTRDFDAAGAPEFFGEWCRRQGVPHRLRLIEGANHNFYSRRWTEEIAREARAWLDALA